MGLLVGKKGGGRRTRDVFQMVSTGVKSVRRESSSCDDVCVLGMGLKVDGLDRADDKGMERRARNKGATIMVGCMVVTAAENAEDHPSVDKEATR